MSDIVTPEWLDDYLKRGFRLVFYNPGQKGPNGKDGDSWPTRNDKAADYIRWKETHNGIEPNVGVFVGHEVAPGRYLADVDFDWSETPKIARKILPRTDFGFGRASRIISHAFYTTPQPATTSKYTDIDDQLTFIEIRGLTKDGVLACQTMVPPSIHPSTEKLELRSQDIIGHAERLQYDCILVAISCILYKHIGDRGFVHDVRLAVAGFLLSEGVTEADVTKICVAITETSGNDAADVPPTVRSTAARIKAHEHVKGRGDLVKVLGKTGQQVINRILKWLGNQDFIYDKKGEKILADNESNINFALDKMGVKISFDSFVNKPFVDYNGFKGPLEDYISDRMWLDLQSTFFFKPSLDYYGRVLVQIARHNSFHPVVNYLASLKWDGVPRVDEWLIKYGGAGESAYTRAVGALVLIAAVKRVRQPGCKFDELMVLESEQGMMKSSALRALCPRDDWFSDDLPLNVDAKQIIERTAGKWIIEASELKGMSGSREMEALKSMLSRQVDGPVRMAYARMAVEQPRQFVVIGTTNSYTYLQDDTGNRRFWPVRVTKFDLPGIIGDRDQLWAEAASREAAGESIRLSEDLYSQAQTQQERRSTQDALEILIVETFKLHFSGLDEPVDFWDPKAILKISNREAQQKIFTTNLGRVDRRTSMRFSSAMQKLGFVTKTMRLADNGMRPEPGWYRDNSKIKKELLE